MQIMFDSVTFTPQDAFRVDRCHVTVSGADSGDFNMVHLDMDRDTCANHTTVGSALMGGKFEWSTFADSGTLTFKLDAYEKANVDPNCLLGTGTASIKLTAAMTLMGDLPVMKTANGCP